MQQLLHHLAQRFALRPTVHLRRAGVPPRNAPVGILGNDGVVGKVNQLCLLPQDVLRPVNRDQRLPELAYQQADQEPHNHE